MQISPKDSRTFPGEEIGGGLWYKLATTAGHFQKHTMGLEKQ
jgi:hypothetical protein